tara:strand:- start:2567 stop:3127 length:561 start_codon:yes stop_codon:yes gene_type:complete
MTFIEINGDLIYTNVLIYESIAKEAFDKMNRLWKKHTSPKPNGKGLIITFDPNRKIFKNALTSIVFTGIWLESLLHILITRKFDEKEFKKHDRKTYKEKLNLLGFTNACQENADVFRKNRNKIVHEKAFLDEKNYQIAPDIALEAYSLRTMIKKELSKMIKKELSNEKKTKLALKDDEDIKAKVVK